MEVASKELFRRHKLSVSPNQISAPVESLEQVKAYLQFHKLGLRGIQSFFIYIFYHYRGIDSQIKV